MKFTPLEQYQAERLKIICALLFFALNSCSPGEIKPGQSQHRQIVSIRNGLKNCRQKFKTYIKLSLQTIAQNLQPPQKHPGGGNGYAVETDSSIIIINGHGLKITEIKR